MVHIEVNTISWLDEAMDDLRLARIKYAAYSDEYQWAKWVREV